MKKRLSVLLIILILLCSGNVFADGVFVDISPENSEVYIGYDDDRIDEMLNTRFISAGNSIPDASMSNSSPDFFSSNIKTSWIWFSLRDINRNQVTGIKVSRIELIQNGIVIARTNDVDSYSIIGEYHGNSLEFINSFENNNGDNLVDVVFYLGSKEVTRLKDFKIGVHTKPIVSRLSPSRLGIYNPKFNLRLTLINVTEDSVVDVFLVDKDGNKVTEVDKISNDYYISNDNTRRMEFNLSFTDDKYLNLNNQYNCVITVDGEKIDSQNVNTNIRMIDFPAINSIYYASMPDLDFWIDGINLVEHGPYKLIVEQNGNVTKELNNVLAVFNEQNYNEEIKIKLLPEYFDSYGELYNVKLISLNGKELLDFDYLVPRDDTSQPEEDITDPFEGFKVFDKKEDVETSKTWRVEFNKALDKNTINNGNAYAINKRTGLSVKVDYSFESNGTVLVMTPEKNFVSGETYILIIDKRIKSELGDSLSQPAAIEFKVK